MNQNKKLKPLEDFSSVSVFSTDKSCSFRGTFQYQIFNDDDDRIISLTNVLNKQVAGCEFNGKIVIFSIRMAGSYFQNIRPSYRRGRQLSKDLATAYEWKQMRPGRFQTWQAN